MSRAIDVQRTDFVTRTELLERYRALPLPTVKDEHWRFTDLSGFDPDAFANAGRRRSPRRPRSSSSTWPGSPGRRGRDRDRARAGRHPLRAAHRRPPAARLARRLATRSSRRTTRRSGSTGCSCTFRRASCSRSRSTSGSRTRSRAARSSGGCSSSPSRRAASRVIEEYVVGVARAARVLERGGRDRRRARREGRVRLGPEPLARDVALRRAPRARRARRRARLGRRRLRLGQGEGVDPERPRRPGRDLARHRRVLRRRHAAPRLRHVPGAHRAATRRPTSRSRARSATRRARSGAG